MKLVRAQFQNFRLLHDLKLEFSCDPVRNLTVIRAANESGKTTILHGLQWALYGNKALPGKGKNFRLHPINWDTSEGNHVSITATVEFEVTAYHRISMSAGAVRRTRRRYRVVRSALEDVGSRTHRSTSSVNLYELKETGASRIEEPAALINDELPPELREVFFTDGDRALSFIEADVSRSVKRKRVRQAIRSLLGLGVIENAIGHVKKSAAVVNRKVQQVGGDSELYATAASLEQMENHRERLETDLEDAKQQFGAFDEKVDKIDREISEALQKGDKIKLSRDRDRTQSEIEQLDSQLVAANKEHSALFRSQSIATDLLEPVLSAAFDILEDLHDQGKIPNTTIPVLVDRLEAAVCICGESLEMADPDGDKRREHIKKLIDESQRADEVQQIITDLYYGAKPPQDGGVARSGAWREEYRKVVRHREDIQALREEAGRRLRGLEEQIDSLPDTDIQGLRETQRQYKDQRDRFLTKQTVKETALEDVRRKYGELEANRDRLLREQKLGALILAERDVTQDVRKVLQSAYERITNEELQKVSTLMNSTFLEMIGADPEQGAIIRRTEISQECDIIVYGPKGRKLNPDGDLNGASRRALTLAFILALTKVSGVEAPNVIDTPLGMTSGFVRRSMLRTALRESGQLILFLTHDEIVGCEEIIDEAAGVVFTLTNPAHYPKMLVNDSGVAERKVLRCGCDHRRECQLCQRRLDTEDGLESKHH